MILKIMQSNYFKFFGIVLFVFNSHNLSAQNQFSHVYNYNFRSGLRIGVIQMATDKDGNIWFKDHNNLGRFNGNQFSYFVHDEDNINSCPLFISDITSDQEESIWLSAGDGLYKYSRPDGFIQHKIFDDSGKLVSGFISVSVDKKNNLWCGNNNGQIFEYNANAKKVLSNARLGKGISIRKIHKAIDGKIWVISDRGIHIINNDHSIIQILKFNIETPYPDDHLFKIIESSNGNILINYKSNIYLFDNETTQLVRKISFSNLKPGDHINDFIEIKPGFLQIASNKGFFTYNGIHEEILKVEKGDFPKEFILESDFVHSILYTKNNILFLGTVKGLSKIQSSAEQFTNFDLGHNLNSKIVFGKKMKILDNDWLIVTQSDGIYRFNPKDEHLTKMNGVENADIQTAFEAKQKDHIFWLENNNLFSGRLNHAGITDIILKKKLPIENLQKVKKDEEDNFWFSQKNKIYKYETSTDIIRTFLSPCDEIVEFLLAPNGEVLLAGTGLYKLKLNGTFDTFPIKTTEPIHSLEFGIENQLYAGAYSGLLVYDLKTGKTRKLTMKNGLLRDYTGNLCKNGNELWITYLEGIQKLEMNTNKIETYNYENGLADNYSLVGVNVIDRETICLGKYGYFSYQKKVKSSCLKGVKFTLENIFIDSIPISEKVISGGLIKIPAFSKQVLINFNFPVFVEPSLYLIQYRLKSERDTTWKQLNQNLTLEFSDLIPNSYLLEVRAIDQNNPEFIESFHFRMVVISPFYQTLWFQLLVLFFSCVLIGFIFYTIYRMKIRQLKRLEDLRLSISRDLHDEMGSNISSIKLLSEFEAGKSNGTAQTSYHKIAVRSSEIMEGMSDIVWSINPANDNMNRIIEKIQSYALEILEPKDILVELKYDTSLFTLSLTLDKRRNFYLIFKEAINNIAKYSEASKVKIEIRQMNKSLIGKISDNGKGFEITSIKKGNGLGNMNNRAKLLDGNIKLESHPGKGTTIQLEFPI